MIIIKKAISLLMTGLISMSMFCSVASADTDALPHLSDYDYRKFADDNIVLNVCNWGEYMSTSDPEAEDVNKLFYDLTGIKVNYQVVDTNETLYAKLKGSAADYDIIIPSDYMISRMIKENMIQKIDYSNIPNMKYIKQQFVNPVYDPKNEYSVPYMWGIVAIIYNTKKVDKDEDVATWNIFWNEKYKDNILMFSNPRDAFAIAQFRNGFSINTEDPAELEKAANDLMDEKPLVQAYVMDEIFGKMEGGSSAIGAYYAGDIYKMMQINPDLNYSIPREGTNRFVDAMCIPATAKHKEAAEMYINFLCETDIALLNCEYVGYSTPHTEAYKLLDDDVKNNKLIYPDDDFLETKTEEFLNLSEDSNTKMQELWNEIKIEQAGQQYLVYILILLALLVVAIVLTVIRKKKKRENY